MTQQLDESARARGVNSADALMLSVAVLVGWNEQREQADGRAMFQALAGRLTGDGHGDALIAARDWLSDPGFSSQDWEFVEDGLSFLRREAGGPIDWNAEVAHCIHPDRRQAGAGPSLPLARSIARLLDLPLSDSVACLFPGAASIAWVLASERDVTLYADRDVAIVMALIARAACRLLRVRRENPIDGSFMPAFLTENPGEQPSPLGHFDHIVSVPPFGMRMQKGGTFEGHHIEHLAPLARRSFTALVPDGTLFREAKGETEFRSKWVTQYRATVLSLPAGMFWPATAISTSLLRLEPGSSSSVRMIDGRSMDKTSTGRVQENMIVQHLERFRSLRAEDTDRAADVPVAELAANSFSLLPDRYLKSANLAALEEALTRNPVVALADVANVERGKAPMPLREPDEDPPLTAMEIAPSDLIDGIVRSPRKQQAFDLKEKSRVEGATVRPGDILVSIKGNVGIVGMVDGVDAALAESMNDPWIISQSLAIIRLKPNPHISSSGVLNALLTAPWVREKLESMSGATTVRTLPISALRGLSLPLPTEEECGRAENQLVEIAAVRERIDEQQRNLAKLQERLWARLWQMPINSGDE
ncbi:N-6 DNA methylase [uncultured Sphingomonas sp.]|uniref:N-6 DNA methylase n=1 Tax=uncultured Sphingomonas sp. TaxID=158754 RepID=UPI002639B6EC|nr:N-6 DNA methylase [uncultured Sphingomonas sp.]